MKSKSAVHSFVSIVLGFFIFQSLSFKDFAQAESLDLKNFADLSQQMGFQTQYAHYVSNKKKTVKIAVLGASFLTYQAELGKTLPKGTVFHTPPLPASEGEEDSLSQHGLYMAQLLVKLMTDNNQKKELEPELHLFPYVYKYSNFEWAINEAIKEKVDIILYSTVKDLGGNNDGKGFINSLVNKALDAGILWVNAAGNYAQTTYNASIERLSGDWIKLPGPNNAVGIRCKPIRDLKECHLRLTLSWNDFKDTTEVGTDKDLDLILSDDALNIFENNRGALIQKISPTIDEPGVSKYPREIIEINLKEGLYFARVKDMSHNFTNSDRLRLVGDGDGISFEQKDTNESLLNPADNARVITVGATDTDRSSMSIQLSKPEIYAPSVVNISKEENFMGTSNSAAFVAAGLALMKMVNPSLTREQFLNELSAPSVVGAGLPLSSLGFYPTGPGCFEKVSFEGNYSYVNDILKKGGELVMTTAGVRIVTPFDPMTLAAEDIPKGRYRESDIIVVTQNGFVLLPREDMLRLAPDIAEVVQLPLGQRICAPALTPVTAKIFKLPIL